MPNKILKGIRVTNGLNQEEMATKLKITRAAYNRKENGKVEFTLNEALIIANIFNRQVEEIFFLKKCTSNNTN